MYPAAPLPRPEAEPNLNLNLSKPVNQPLVPAHEALTGEPGGHTHPQAAQHPAPHDRVLVCSHADPRPRGRPGERLHHLFEQRCDALQAEGQSAHLAVDSASGTLTYGELDALANRLARLLRQRGTRPGDLVGLLFDKSAWSYAAMLAVGKLHAAYLPLDAGFPAERIQFITQDAGARCMLSTTAHQGLLTATGLPVLCLDALADAMQALPSHRLSADEAGAPVSELAYVIYTSGSTGRPKGVPIDQPSIVNFVHVAAETYGYRADDRVYQGLTLAFDFAVEEIWVPLAVGATLLPNQTGGSLLGPDLADFLRQHRATALCCVPTLLATLDDELPLLRLLIVSGEACPRDLVRRWHRPGRQFLNAYGPTEATVTATLARPLPDQAMTIGQPLPTYAIVILAPDEARALPFGEEGEIGIAGIGISRGYLNRDEQTRKVFIDDFIGIPHNTSGRIYRTGDLGRINAQQEVEYLGRIDTQVKIRGYRIELAEIESLLLQLPQVAQAVVNPWESSPGVVELVAYYTTAPGPAGQTPGELQAERNAALPAIFQNHLRAQLPPYMVPAYFEHLPSMPLLASDKADRKALPPPRQVRALATAGASAAPRAAVAPQTALQATLAQALAGLLQLPQVSIDDQFFDDLGTNSLLLAQYSARLRQALAAHGLGGSVSMRDLYGHPSVRRLATHLATQHEQQAAAAAQAARADAATPGNAAAAAGSTAGAGGPAPHTASQHPAHQASLLAYVACGAAQAVLALLFVAAHAAAWWEGVHWVIDAPSWAQAWGRAVGFSALYFGAAALLPVVLKWLLVGRWRAEQFPVWGWRYLRFWLVKELVRRSPLALMTGSPLYPAYLRLLGARIHPTAVFAARIAPVCTDLLRVDAGAVVGAHVHLAGYHVVGGRVRTGPVHIGALAQVGEGALVDIDTRMGEGSTLAHASSLQAGQALPAGTHWHGSPAVPANTAAAPLRTADQRAVARGHAVGALRRTVYAACELALALGLVLPIAPLLAFALWGEAGHALDAAGATGAALAQAAAQAEAGGAAGGLGQGWVGWLGVTWLLYLGGLAVGLVGVSTVPRLLSRCLQPGRAYPLYGLHYAVLSYARALSNVPLYNALFGDSSAIVHYLRAIGWRLPGLQQTGSNFGMAQQHDVPTLNSVGAGTMVSDGLALLNAEYGSQVFRVLPVAVGANCFLGNAQFVPAGHRVGDNCLLATKAMWPTDGERREGVGLLGSPPMAIPRSVRRDAQFDHYKQPDVLAQRLRLKNRANARGMLAYVLANGVPLCALGLAWQQLYPVYALHDTLFAAAFAVASAPLVLLWMVAVDAASRGFVRLVPQTCSIYDAYFWRHERHWKLGLANDQPLLGMLNGTPFKALAWRLMGVRVGRRLFDDGCAMPEKTLVQLGDHVTLGAMCTLQGHSLEDGSFKSDHISVGHGCTVGANAYVHYAVQLEDGAEVAPDAFVMKGSVLQARELWRGNPAQAQARASGMPVPATAALPGAGQPADGLAGLTGMPGLAGLNGLTSNSAGTGGRRPVIARAETGRPVP